MEQFLLKNRTKRKNFSNIQITNESHNSNSPFSHRRVLSYDSTKSKSILKLHELQNEFKAELKSKMNIISISPKNNLRSKNNLLENYTKASINTNKLIRNSSLCSFKRNNPLNDMISITENKSKYLTRNNSKIWKNINKVKEKIEGKYINIFKNPQNNHKKNNGVNTLFKNYLSRNNNSFKKKAFLKNNFTYRNKNPFINEKEKKYVFSSKIIKKENNENIDKSNGFYSERINKKEIEKNISTINSYINTNGSNKKSYLNIETDDDYKIILGNLNKLKL